MKELLKKTFLLRDRYKAPTAPTGLMATPGGGSMETQLTWDPLPNDESIAQYRVYRRRGIGTFWLLAVVTHQSLGLLEPGRYGIVDAPDYWPWPTGSEVDAERCYCVTAVSNAGLEGPMSALACVMPL